MQDQPNYTELFKVIRDEMGRRANEGEPLRINIWDGNHTSAAPADIATHPELYEIASQYGTPGYVIEEVSSPERFNDQFDTYLHDPEKRAEIRADLAPEGEEPDRFRFDRLLNFAAKGSPVIFPDPRSTQEIKSLTEPEVAALKEFLSRINEAGLECASQFVPQYLASLAGEERSILQSAMVKYQAATSNNRAASLSIADIEKEIVTRIDDAFPLQTTGIQDGTIPITIYGFSHFSKPHDLDEYHPGLDIAVVDAPGSVYGLAKESGRDIRTLIQDLPEYVYYSDSGGLERLDTDAARNRFLYGNAQGIPPDLSHQCESLIQNLIYRDPTETSAADTAPLSRAAQRGGTTLS